MILKFKMSLKIDIRPISKLCGEVPPVLVTRTNKVTITLHADMSSDIHNQVTGLKQNYKYYKINIFFLNNAEILFLSPDKRFKVQLMRTMDPPFIPRGAIKAINGQKANENVINSFTVQQSSDGHFINLYIKKFILINN